MSAPATSAPAAPATPASSPAAKPTPVQGTFTLQPPKGEEIWSSWYNEVADTFDDFQAHETGAGGNTPTRQLSARQLSGQFEDDVAKTWEEDWEDEDLDDTFDAVMAQIARYPPKK
jgi:hypothetical protein